MLLTTDPWETGRSESNLGLSSHVSWNCLLFVGGVWVGEFWTMWAAMLDFAADEAGARAG